MPGFSVSELEETANHYAILAEAQRLHGPRSLDA